MRNPPPPLRFSNTTGILQKNTMWFIGVEVEKETSAPPPKKNPGSAPELCGCKSIIKFTRTTKTHTVEIALVWTWPKAPLNWSNIILIHV